MKDQALLLLAGVACATLAWAFWHFLGAEAFNVITLLTLVSVIADNFRLRSLLRKKKHDS